LTSAGVILASPSINDSFSSMLRMVCCMVRHDFLLESYAASSRVFVEHQYVLL
jgi:hypothetical protein